MGVLRMLDSHSRKSVGVWTSGNLLLIPEPLDVYSEANLSLCTYLELNDAFLRQTKVHSFRFFHVKRDLGDEKHASQNVLTKPFKWTTDSEVKWTTENVYVQQTLNLGRFKQTPTLCSCETGSSASR